MPDIDLLDINVWIALSSPDHEHHVRAQRYWNDEAANQFAFCTLTMMGLVRTCSNAPIFNGATLSVQEAWAIYQRWSNRSDVTYLIEAPNCRKILNDMVLDGNIQPRTWTDCYLAAMAKSTGSRLVLFDSDFKRFDGLNFLHLQI